MKTNADPSAGALPKSFPGGYVLSPDDKSVMVLALGFVIGALAERRRTGDENYEPLSEACIRLARKLGVTVA